MRICMCRDIHTLEFGGKEGPPNENCLDKCVCLESVLALHLGWDPVGLANPWDLFAMLLLANKFWTRPKGRLGVCFGSAHAPRVGFASALGRISVSAFVLVSGPVPDSVRITDSALNLSVGFGFKLGFGLGRRIGFAFDFGFGFAFRLGFIISFGVDFGFWFGFGFGFSLRLWCGLC